MKKSYLLTSTITSLSICLSAIGGDFTNGSFELPSTQTEAHIEQGDKSLTGWEIGGIGSSVSVLRLQKPPTVDFDPIEGNQHLVFNTGNGQPGTWIRQAFSTKPGVEYQVTFYDGRSGNGNSEVSLTVTAENSEGQLLGLAKAAPPAHGYGPKQIFRFHATSAESRIVFTDTSLGTDAVDVWLDAVQVVPVTPRVNIRVSQVELSWETDPNQWYQIQQETIPGGQWENVGARIMGNGETAVVQLTVPPNSNRMFRVVVNP